MINQLFQIINNCTYLRIVVFINVFIIICSLIFGFDKFRSNGTKKCFISDLNLIGRFSTETILIIGLNFKEPTLSITIFAEVLYLILYIYRKNKIYNNNHSNCNLK